MVGMDKEANADPVKKIHRISAELGVALATPREAWQF
jgi:hypothetical protein